MTDKRGIEEDENVFSPIITNLIKTYPRWEKKYFGAHWVSIESDDDDEDDDGFWEPDEDAVWIDVWVPVEPTAYSLLPKYNWNTGSWKEKADPSSQQYALMYALQVFESRMDWNAVDLGVYGKVVKLEYIKNYLKELRERLKQ